MTDRLFAWFDCITEQKERAVEEKNRLQKRLEDLENRNTSNEDLQEQVTKFLLASAAVIPACA